jgi:hypothetical protein
MSKPIQILIAVVAVVLAIGAAVLYGKVRTQSTQLATTQVSEQQAQDRYNRTIDAIAEIQDSLDAISVGPGAQIVPGNLRREQNMGGPNGQQALDRIALLRSSIQANKERITQLEANLKKSGMKTAGLQKLIAGLKRTVDEKEMQVAVLSSRVDSLHTQVTGLTQTVAEREDTLHTRDTQLEDRRRELATVYYVVGKKDDLKKSGVIQSSGGVLGLGKTVLPAANPDPAAFTAMDTDQSSVIHIASKSARVISAQPASSYQLVPAGTNEMELRILNPVEFRKIKQVVILAG